MSIEFVNNSLILDAQRWDSLRKTSKGAVYIKFLDLIAILLTENRTQPMVKVIKTRFFPNDNKEYTIEEFKKLCEDYVL